MLPLSRSMRSARPAQARTPAAALLAVVRLSSERVRQAVRQDCSVAKKQASRPALPVVVQSSHLSLLDRFCGQAST
jgi:hypothetical protein